MSDLVFLSASQLAKVILNREVSAVEVLEAHLRQIARHNPAINAIATLNEEQAPDRAQQADVALAREKGNVLDVGMRIRENQRTQTS